MYFLSFISNLEEKRNDEDGLSLSDGTSFKNALSIQGESIFFFSLLFSIESFK